MIYRSSIPVALLYMLALLGSTSSFGESSEQILAQEVRRDVICARTKNSTLTPSGAQIAKELNGLTNRYRAAALNCMIPEQSFIIQPEDQVRIVGVSSDPYYIKRMICRMADMLPANIQVNQIAKLLGSLKGRLRLQTLRCIKNKIPNNLTLKDVDTILGPINNKSDPSWTSKSYNADDHLNGLCILASHLRADISAAEASDLLGLSRNRQRLKGLRCLNEKLKNLFTWKEIDQIIGPSITSIGAMIDVLGTRTPDGMNTKKIRIFHDEFIGNRFLVDPDPPKWLMGQCVEWARLLFNEVSETQLKQAFGLAKNIPSRSESAGFVVEKDPIKAKVGALIVWSNGGAGHVGVVTSVSREQDSGEVNRISVSEANWDSATASGARRWGLTLAEAQSQYVTDMYGKFSIRTFKTDNLDRPSPGTREPLSYKFSAYVIPVSSNVTASDSASNDLSNRGDKTKLNPIEINSDSVSSDSRKPDGSSAQDDDHTQNQDTYKDKPTSAEQEEIVQENSEVSTIPVQSNVCGSTASRYLVPDHVCFDEHSGRVFYSKCSSTGEGDKTARQSVDFTAACQSHDACYGTKGASKSDCDASFYGDLKQACREQAGTTGHEALFRACIDTALQANDVVRGQRTRIIWDKYLIYQIPYTSQSGCDSYMAAQKRAGNSHPTCTAK